MPHLLHIDSSLAPEGSVSRGVAEAYAESWRKHHPDGTLTHRDLATSPPPHLNWALVSGGQTPPEQRTPEQAEAVKIREEYLEEVESADEYVISVPMYNYAYPSTIKAWLDQVIVMGRTAGGTAGDGVLAGRKVTVITAQGGSYAPGAPKEGWDHQVPYLRHAFEALGADNIEFITVVMTLSKVNPALAAFTDVFEASRTAAEQAARDRAAA
ncbi:FMN-dependent NADH-azoreductase [Parafrankia soli]|uniref:FMN dependent NADH:quinone oxidoreductase n=1 Tax=Parafrankia soli TaxID=2599596 RepID=A0A1S1PMH9_9ACTN|nr:NAD(P)H-dependent oxidoreductase [Parafrankia soli]OHV22481.1 FMN-dependent NADH-azoreductase [Parafrankia soli]